MIVRWYWRGIVGGDDQPAHMGSGCAGVDGACP